MGTCPVRAIVFPCVIGTVLSSGRLSPDDRRNVDSYPYNDHRNRYASSSFRMMNQDPYKKRMSRSTGKERTNDLVFFQDILEQINKAKASIQEAERDLRGTKSFDLDSDPPDWRQCKLSKVKFETMRDLVGTLLQTRFSINEQLSDESCLDQETNERIRTNVEEIDEKVRSEKKNLVSLRQEQRTDFAVSENLTGAFERLSDMHSTCRNTELIILDECEMDTKYLLYEKVAVQCDALATLIDEARSCSSMHDLDFDTEGRCITFLR